MNGECQICKDTYYVDSLTGGCVEVSFEERVEHCTQYDSNTQCLRCNLNYFLDSSKNCVSSESLIENCQQPRASDPSFCETCLPGKLLSTDGKKCLDPPPETCNSFKNAQCVECSPGYVLNPNNYLLSISKFETSSQGQAALTQMLRNQGLGTKGLVDPIVCTQPTVSNCLKLVKFNECEICEDNYFLDDQKACVKNPEDQIQHCTLYKTNLECLLCKDHYYFVANDPSICLTGEVVENCETYSVNEDSCAKCTDDFFLDGNECKERVASKNMLTCLTLNPSKDECQICKDTFALTLAGCQPGIDNCHTYEDVATSREELVCEKCKDGFYFDAEQNKCVQPASFETDFCFQYKFNQPVCDVCKDRYFFDAANTICKIHDNIDPNCATSSLTTRNSCQECNQGFKAYSAQTICKPVNSAINFCEEYQTEVVCKRCALNYFGNTCQPIDANLNCQRVEVSNASNCDLCKEGYFTNETPYNKQCVQPFSTQADQCEAFELSNNESKISCTQCKENTYPVRYDSHGIFACEPNSNYTNQITNGCQMSVFDGNTSSYECVMCESGLVLDDGNCLQSCSNGKIHRKLSLGMFDDNTEVKINTQNDCVDATNYTDCEVIVPRVDVTVDNIEYVCAECNSSTMKIVDIEGATARLKVHNYDESQGQFKVGLRNPAYTCETVTGSDLAGTQSLNNCELFTKFTVSAATKYGCIKCAMGMTGTVVKADASVDIWVIQECSVSIPGCLSSETDLKGVTFPSIITGNVLWTSYENYLSCIQCQGSASSIPFISMVLDSKKIVLKNYKDASILDGDITALAGDETTADFVGTAVSCRDYTVPTEFGLPDNTSITFISNCAVGVFEVDQDTTAKAIYCIACKKGFDPVMSGHKITNCDPIAKCTSSNVFNACSNCETPYNENTSRCNSDVFSDPNCLRVRADACIACKAQYTVNADGKCEKISAFQCKAGKIELPGGFLSGDMDFVISEADRLGIALSTYGCSECESGFTSIGNLAISNVCLESEYLSIGSISTPTNFIRNCLKYGYNFSNNTLICKICTASLIPNGSATECVTALPGCLQTSAGNDSVCHTCDTGRTLIGSNCVSNNIANCQEFSTDGSTLFCEKCDPGYYILNRTQCIAGKVLNCNIYENNSDEECVECNSQYVIYRNVEGKTFCLSYERFNCLKWTNASSFACDTCAAGYFPAAKVDTDPNEFCIGGNYSIDNCAALDTSLLCTHCNQGYYLSSSKTRCITREKIVDRCKTYEVSQDACEVCENGYYLATNGNCYKYPIGIQYCRDYANIDTCIQCDTNKYLSDGICLNVTQFVDNCMLYKAEGECAKCKDTHMLADPSTCIQIEAKDCVTIKSHLECLTCRDGFGLSENNGITSCVEVNLANCMKNTTSEPYTCTFCDEGFYLFEEGCIKANPEIEACLYYTDNLHCSQCKEFFVLSADKTECLSNYVVSPQIDFNCKIYHERQFTCSSCDMNQQFVLESEQSAELRLLNNSLYGRSLQAEVFDIFKYQCKQCGGDGCMTCDPVSASKCFICQPGFHMDPSGACVDDNPDTGTDDGPDISASVWSICSALLFVWLGFN